MSGMAVRVPRPPVRSARLCAEQRVLVASAGACVERRAEHELLQTSSNRLIRGQGAGPNRRNEQGPLVARPEWARPEVARPEVARPEVARPEWARPEPAPGEAPKRPGLAARG